MTDVNRDASRSAPHVPTLSEAQVEQNP